MLSFKTVGPETVRLEPTLKELFNAVAPTTVPVPETVIVPVIVTSVSWFVL